MNCLRCTSNLEDLCNADVVIEAIVESEEVKKKLFSELDKITKASAILASNTSSISITRLASVTRRPSQVHFKDPVIIYVRTQLYKPSYLNCLSSMVLKGF